MDRLRQDNITKVLVFVFIVYCVCSIPMAFEFGFVHLVLAWNYFLALAPLFFARALYRVSSSGCDKLWLLIGLACLWLLFFPNAPYMMTDFIHISRETFFSRENAYAPMVYNLQIGMWLRLIHIGTGMLCGTASGMLSLYLMHQWVLGRFGKKVTAVFLITTSLLSGIAIYIGRFLRFNSWDILRPFTLLSKTVRSLSLFSGEYILLFSGYVLLVYFLFYAFYHLPKTDRSPETSTSSNL